MFKKIFTVMIVLMWCLSAPCFAESGDISTAIEVNIENQLGRDYEFDFMGLSDIKADLTSQVYTIGAAISIGDNLVITPRIGTSDSEIEIAEVVTLENTAGLVLGISGSWTLAEPVDGLSVSLIGDYLYAHSTVDKIQLMNLTIDNPLRTDIYRHDLEGGIELAYSDLPLNGVVSLGVVYSSSSIEIDANLAILNLDLELESTDGFGLRPAIAFSPVDDLTVALEGKIIDQEAIGVKVSYRF